VDTSVAGVDVAGDRKGFHIVILHGQRIVACTRIREPEAIRSLCGQFHVHTVAVDAPSSWAPPHGPREAERALSRLGLRYFLTPSEERARQSRFYDWVRNGLRLYKELVEEYPLVCPGMKAGEAACCFETFPHAVASVVLGRPERWQEKWAERRRALELVGVLSPLNLRNQNEVDAALCAAMAWLWQRGQAILLGDSAGGYIVLPSVQTSAG